MRRILVPLRLKLFNSLVLQIRNVAPRGDIPFAYLGIKSTSRNPKLLTYFTFKNDDDDTKHYFSDNFREGKKEFVKFDKCKHAKHQ